MIKRIAVINGNCVRDTQIFSGNPAVFEHEDSSNYDDQFIDVRYPCHYIGIFEGINEEKIRRTVAEENGIHPDSITLIELGCCSTEINGETAQEPEQESFICLVCKNHEHSEDAVICKICGNPIGPAALYAAQCGFDKLREHVGHNIEIAIYGGNTNVAVECTDCYEVLFSVDNPGDDRGY